MSSLSGFHKTVGLAILSWKAPRTVRASLESYIAKGLFSLFDDVVLCFQEISDDDIALAKEFGIRYVGTPTNTGIQGGFRMAYQSLRTDYVIILENDLRMIADKEEARKQLLDCLNMLEQKVIDAARLRSRFTPGFPIRAASGYSRMFPIRELHHAWENSEPLDDTPDWMKYLRRTLRPNKARKWSGRSVYVEQNPEKLFPHIISKHGNYLIVDSSALPWTNQPTLVSRKLLGELLDYADTHPSSRTVNGFQDFEKPLNCRYWKRRHYKIAVSPGIFTHQRLDR